MDSYRSYTDKEGERRGEVERIKAQTAENRGIVEAAVEMAEETQEYIDSWESDDDDDELDEEELCIEPVSDSIPLLSERNC